MTDYIGTIDGLMHRVTDLEAELAAVRRVLNAEDDGNLASLAETMMAQRRLLAEALLYALPTVMTEDDIAPDTLRLVHSILADEPAPAGDERREVGEALYNACKRALQGYHNILELDLMPHKGYDEDTQKIIAEIDAALLRARKLQESRDATPDN